MGQIDRQPITTYEQAVWRLVQYTVSERYSFDQLDLAVQIVADLHWLSDAKVRHDVEKKARSVRASCSAPLPVRGLSPWPC